MSVVCEVYCVLCSRELNYYLDSSCFSLVYLRPIFRPVTVVSEVISPFLYSISPDCWSCNSGVRSLISPFIFPSPLGFSILQQWCREVGSVGKVTRVGFFFFHCLLFVVSKPDQTGEMDPSPDTAFPAQAAPPAPVQATPVMVLTREVDVRKFFGDNSTRAQEFKEDIRRALDAQPTLSSRRRLDLILNNVGPKVKAEGCCLEADVRTDPEQVLAAIVQSFGESRSSSMLKQALLMTTQRQGESVRDYFHRAKEA